MFDQELLDKIIQERYKGYQNFFSINCLEMMLELAKEHNMNWIKDTDRWIKVTDRLPDSKRNVLIWDDNQIKLVMFDFEFYKRCGHISFRQIDGCGCCEWGNAPSESEYWMELPEKPNIT